MSLYINQSCLETGGSIVAFILGASATATTLLYGDNGSPLFDEAPGIGALSFIGGLLFLLCASRLYAACIQQNNQEEKDASPEAPTVALLP